MAMADSASPMRRDASPGARVPSRRLPPGVGVAAVWVGPKSRLTYRFNNAVTVRPFVESMTNDPSPAVAARAAQLLKLIGTNAVPSQP